MRVTLPMLLALVAVWLTGCQKPVATPSGFLSDYGMLEEALTDRGASWVSPRMKTYRAARLAEVAVRLEGDQLTENQRNDLREYLHQAAALALAARGLQEADEAGPGVMDVRVAMTEVRRSTWWLSIHPATKLSGSGAGGAAIEGEALDSLTGEQIAAAIWAGQGNAAELDTFSPLDDAQDVIDRFARQAIELHESLGDPGEPAR